MDIVAYRDLENKDELFILWLKSFGWPGSAGWLAKFKRYESRIGVGPVGMCGLIDGEMVGFVGIMTIPTRTKQGKIEMVGGIFGVAVSPAYARRGIGRMLLQASEEYLRQQGIRLSFLTTSRSIVAYDWYREVGYEVIKSVEEYPYLYKTFKTFPAVERKVSPSRTFKLDLRQVRDLFDLYNQSHCGFVIRNQKDLKAREMEGTFSRKLSISADGGYALLKGGQGAIQFMEILARNEKTYNQVIKLAESKAKHAAVAIHPFDPQAQEALKKTDYQFHCGSYGVLMCKSLAKTSFADLYDESFMLSRLDWF
jgi:ribosomal protein S18 acetylase RimI-like enzyme